jgi:hypothetical protein
MPSGSVNDPSGTLAVGRRGNLVDHGLNGEGAPRLPRLRAPPRLVTAPERVSFAETLAGCERLEMRSRSFVGAPEAPCRRRRSQLDYSADLAGRNADASAWSTDSVAMGEVCTTMGCLISSVASGHRCTINEDCASLDDGRAESIAARRVHEGNTRKPCVLPPCPWCHRYSPLVAFSRPRDRSPRSRIAPT